MHRREQAHAMQMGIRRGSFHALEGVGLRGIDHEVAEEAIRMGCDGSGHALLVSRSARDENCAGYSVTVEFGDPAARQRAWISERDIPVEQRRKGLRSVYFFLARQSRIKVMREEMHVCVSDR